MAASRALRRGGLIISSRFALDLRNLFPLFEQGTQSDAASHIKWCTAPSMRRPSGRQSAKFVELSARPHLGVTAWQPPFRPHGTKAGWGGTDGARHGAELRSGLVLIVYRLWHRFESNWSGFLPELPGQVPCDVTAPLHSSERRVVPPRRAVKRLLREKSSVRVGLTTTVVKPPSNTETLDQFTRARWLSSCMAACHPCSAHLF